VTRTLHTQCINNHLLRVLQLVVKFHQRGLIAASVAVVWCTENGDYVLVMAPVVALRQQTFAMCTTIYRCECSRLSI